MKKLLLACAAASIGICGAYGETYQVNFADASSQLTASTYTGSQEINLNDVAWNLEITKGASSYYFGKDGNKGLQIGSKANWASSVNLSTDAFESYAIESVSIELSVASGGAWTGTLSVGGETLSIPSLTTSVNTYTLDGIYVTGGNIELSMTNTAAALYIGNIKVVYSEASNLEAAELSFPEAEYSVKFPNGTFTAPTLSKVTDAVASYSSSNEAVATVDAETGAVTIVKPGTTVITAKCEANDKYAAGSAKYTLTVFAAASSLQDLSELAALDAAGTFQIDCPLTVTYVNKRNVYVVDAQGAATLIYMANAEDAANYTVGDVLSTEWFVTYSPYFGLPEYVPAGTLPTVTAQNATFDIPELSLGDVNDDYICKVINIKDLTFDNSLPAESNVNTVITDGDASLTFRNTFGIPAFTPEAGKEYNVKGVLSVYENAQGRTLQFLPIEISVASGVASIEANEGVATYYDLNGRQVKGQLANGLYIRVLNGKASKVIVK